MSDQVHGGDWESVQRVPYTMETWPGYKFIRSLNHEGMWLGPYNLSGPCLDGVFENEVKLLWKFIEIANDSNQGSHDGVTWYPCYEGGEPSAERVPTPDDAVIPTYAEIAQEQIDDLRSQLANAQKMYAKEVERSRTMADELTAEIESLKAERDRLAVEKCSLEKQLADEMVLAAKVARREGMIQGGYLQRISELLEKMDSLQSELAAERRWQMRLRELNEDDRWDISLTNSGDGFEAYDALEIDQVGGPWYGPTPAAAVDAAAKALATDDGDDEPSAAPQVEIDENGTPQLFTASKQDGIPGHCIVAQVFGPDGNSVAKFTTTADPEVASRHAKLCAETLNRHYDSVSNRPTPRFTLTPDGCGVLDRERPGVVCPLKTQDGALLAIKCFTDGVSNPGDYGWIPYTPPEAAAPEHGTCPYCSGPLSFDTGHAATREEPGQNPSRYCQDCGVDVDRGPNQGRADGQQQVGGGRAGQIGASVDSRQSAHDGSVVAAVQDAQPSDTANEAAGETVTETGVDTEPTPHTWDGTPSDNPQFVIEVGGLYGCRDGVTTAEVISESSSNGEYRVLLRRKGRAALEAFNPDGTFPGSEAYDLVRRLPDVVTVEVDPEIVKSLKERGYRPVAYREIPRTEAHHHMNQNGDVIRYRELVGKFALIVEPIPAVNGGAE